MLIIGGTFEVEPEQREAFLADRRDLMRASRAQPGCLEYLFSADPLDPGRVVLFERWADQASLDAHLGAAQATRQAPGSRVEAMSSTVTVYDVSGERPLQR